MNVKSFYFNTNTDAIFLFHFIYYLTKVKYEFLLYFTKITFHGF